MMKIDETLRQRVKKAIQDLTVQLDYLNDILGPVPIGKTHELLPDFSEILLKLSKQLELIMAGRKWLETVPSMEDLEALHKIASVLGGALYVSEKSAQK